jgi:transposase InsO family protein
VYTLVKGLRSVFPQRLPWAGLPLWETVQVDVKFVKISGRAFRVLRLYRRPHQTSNLLNRVYRGFPFRIRRLQCNKGQEFPFSFALVVQTSRSGIGTSRAPNKTARSNGATGSTRRNSGGRRRFDDFDPAGLGLRAWERHYNHERFSIALQGRIPAEKLGWGRSNSLLPSNTHIDRR